MAILSIVDEARELFLVPKTWPNEREKATEKLLLRMAEEIERQAAIIAHLCPDKSDDV